MTGHKDLIAKIKQAKDITRLALTRLPEYTTVAAIAREAAIPAVSLYAFRRAGSIGNLRVLALQEALIRLEILDSDGMLPPKRQRPARKIRHGRAKK